MTGPVKSFKEARSPCSIGFSIDFRRCNYFLNWAGVSVPGYGMGLLLS